MHVCVCVCVCVCVYVCVCVSIDYNTWEKVGSFMCVSRSVMSDSLQPHGL